MHARAQQQPATVVVHQHGPDALHTPGVGLLGVVAEDVAALGEDLPTGGGQRPDARVLRAQHLTPLALRVGEARRERPAEHDQRSGCGRAPAAGSGGQRAPGARAERPLRVAGASQRHPREHREREQRQEVAVDDRKGCDHHQEGHRRRAGPERIASSTGHARSHPEQRVGEQQLVLAQEPSQRRRRTAPLAASLGRARCRAGARASGRARPGGSPRARAGAGPPPDRPPAREHRRRALASRWCRGGGAGAPSRAPSRADRPRRGRPERAEGRPEREDSQASGHWRSREPGAAGLAQRAQAAHDVRTLHLGDGRGAPATSYLIHSVRERRRLLVNTIAIARAARKLVAESRPDVVHGSAAEASLLTAVLPPGVGVVATSHHPDPPALPRTLGLPRARSRRSGGSRTPTSRRGCCATRTGSSWSRAGAPMCCTSVGICLPTARSPWSPTAWGPSGSARTPGRRIRRRITQRIERPTRRRCCSWAGSRRPRDGTCCSTRWPAPRDALLALAGGGARPGRPRPGARPARSVRAARTSRAGTRRGAPLPARELPAGAARGDGRGGTGGHHARGRDPRAGRGRHQRSPRARRRPRCAGQGGSRARTETRGSAGG